MKLSSTIALPGTEIYNRVLQSAERDPFVSLIPPDWASVEVLSSDDLRGDDGIVRKEIRYRQGKGTYGGLFEFKESSLLGITTGVPGAGLWVVTASLSVV